jgi:hypothetical protein
MRGSPSMLAAGHSPDVREMQAWARTRPSRQAEAVQLDLRQAPEITGPTHLHDR